MEMIDKSAIVAEIERIKEDAGIGLNAYEMGEENGKLEVCDKLLSFLDTLEVKDVDLDNEVTSYIQGNTRNGYFRADIHDVAKHFFELGIKVKKGE